MPVPKQKKVENEKKGSGEKKQSPHFRKNTQAFFDG